MRAQAKKSIYMTIVVLLILGLGAIYIWQISQDDEDEEDTSSLFIELIDREETDVTRIVFTTTDGSEELLPVEARDGSIVWEVDTAFLLNPVRVWDKARSAWGLNAQSIAHENALELDLGEFGFNPPLLTKDVYYEDGSHNVIRVGGKTSDMNFHFVMINDDPAMYLVSTFAVNRMLLELGDMLDTALPAFDIHEARFVQISQRGNEDIIFSMADGSEFFEFSPNRPDEFLNMAEPYPGLGLNHFVINETIFEPLAALRINDLVALEPESTTEFGFYAPHLEFVYENAFERIHLIFGSTFIDENDEAMIYVMFADRPHVFQIPERLIDSILDIHVFSLLERHIALVDNLDVYSVTVQREGVIEFDMVFNHDPAEGSRAISPTINGNEIPEREFRTVYRTIISLSADSTVAPFAAEGEPYVRITFNRINNPNTIVEFFPFDSTANFFAVSVDGADVWQVTSIMQLNMLFGHLEGYR